MNKPRPPKKPKPVDKKDFRHIKEEHIDTDGTVAELISRLQKIPVQDTHIIATYYGTICIRYELFDNRGYETALTAYANELARYREEYKKYLKVMEKYVEQGREI